MTQTAAAQAAHDATARPKRWTPLLTLVSGLSLLGAACALAYCILSPLTDDLVLNGRFHELFAALPSVARGPEPSVWLLGSSLAEVDFSPPVFDQRMREHGLHTTSFDAGITGATPDLLWLVARRVHASLLQAHKRPEVVLLDFTPHLATRATRTRSGQMLMNDSRRALLLDPGAWLRIGLRSPDAAASLATLWLLRGHAPAYARQKLRQVVFKQAQPGPAPGRVTWGAHWDAAERGGPRLEPDAARSDARPSEAAMASHARWLVEDYDAQDLDFDPELVADFIASVEELRSVAKHTFVVLPPRNQRWLSLSPIGRARLAQVLARISAETGVSVLDFSDAPGLGERDFGDCLHLDQGRGPRTFSRLLADRVSASLGAP
ncbi:MAG: hypothetical protein JWN48_2572 [Myxococcaceae bacterium]|nr:hypothetical protein [Myxococcaceae bacterium]